MQDFKLNNLCDHKICQLITISGTSPDYYTYLDYEPNKTRYGVYVNRYDDSDDLDNFAMQGFGGQCLSFVGITNWTFDPVEPTKINFPYSSEMASVDGNKELVPQPVYVMSYYAVAANCPKCNNTSMVSDVAFDTVGKLNTVTGYGKVKQQLVKILLTVIGDNLYDSQYGSQISSSVGQKFTAYVSANIQYSIYRAIQHLIKVQQEGSLPDNETIAQLSNVTVEQTNDVRAIKLSVSVITADNQEVTTGLKFQLQ